EPTIDRCGERLHSRRNATCQPTQHIRVLIDPLPGHLDRLREHRAASSAVSEGPRKARHASWAVHLNHRALSRLDLNQPPTVRRRADRLGLAPRPALERTVKASPFDGRVDPCPILDIRPERPGIVARRAYLDGVLKCPRSTHPYPLEDQEGVRNQSQ